jgi:hypothetical protein
MKVRMSTMGEPALIVVRYLALAPNGAPDVFASVVIRRCWFSLAEMPWFVTLEALVLALSPHGAGRFFDHTSKYLHHTRVGLP